VIYFVRVVGHEPIKIGFSEDVSRRLAAFRTHHWGNVEVLLVMPGLRDDEKAIHQRFEPHRIRGEWFMPAPDVVRFVEDNRHRHVPEWEDAAPVVMQRAMGTRECLGCGLCYGVGEERTHARHHREWLAASAVHGRIRAYAELERAKELAWPMAIAGDKSALRDIVRAHFERRIGAGIGSGDWSRVGSWDNFAKSHRVANLALETV